MKTTPQPAPAAAAPADTHGGTPHYGTFGQPKAAAARPLPQAPGDYCGLDADLPATASEATRRAAYARQDPRYAGGDVYDLPNEQTSL